MFCPKCGAEVRPEEKLCQSCGTPLAQTPIETQQPAAPAAEPAPRPNSFKEFIMSPYCTPDVNKTIRASWIILFVCAGISAIVQVAGGSFPVDGIIMAAIAVWLMLSKSFAAGVTACVVGVLELVLTSIMMGRLAGWLPALAGVYALTAVLKARKQYKAFLGQ